MSYSPSSRDNRSRRAPIPSRRSLSVYHSLLAWRSIAYYWFNLMDRMVSVTHQWSRRRHALLPHRAASGLRWFSHLDHSVDGGPCICIHQNNRPLLSLSLAKLASSTSPQKPPASYTWVNDFGPHKDSIFRGRLIRESDLYASIYCNVNIYCLKINRECLKVLEKSLNIISWLQW